MSARSLPLSTEGLNLCHQFFHFAGNALVDGVRQRLLKRPKGQRSGTGQLERGALCSGSKPGDVQRLLVDAPRFEVGLGDGPGLGSSDSGRGFGDGGGGRSGLWGSAIGGRCGEKQAGNQECRNGVD